MEYIYNKILFFPNQNLSHEQVTCCFGCDNNFCQKEVLARWKMESCNASTRQSDLTTCYRVWWQTTVTFCNLFFLDFVLHCFSASPEIAPAFDPEYLSSTHAVAAILPQTYICIIKRHCLHCVINPSICD